MLSSLYRSRKYPTTAAITRVRSDHECSVVVISGLVLPNLCSPTSAEFKSAYAALWVINQSPCSPYSTDETLTASSLLYRYYYGKFSDELHSLVPPSQTFTAKTHPKTTFLVCLNPGSTDIYPTRPHNTFLITERVRRLGL